MAKDNDGDAQSLSDASSEMTCVVEDDKEALLTIKERLALLDGAFPMDEAVVDGDYDFTHSFPSIPGLNERQFY